MLGSGKRIHLARLCTVAALAAVGCAGKENWGCPAVDAQGGPALGKWSVSGACTVPYDRVSSSDWCSQLVYDANGIRQVWLGHPTVPFKQGTIEFDGGGHYTSELVFETLAGMASTSFTRACLNAYGQQPTCGELAGALGAFLGDPSAAIQSYKVLTSIMFLPIYPPGLAPQAFYTNFVCEDDGSNGCNCAYDVGLTISDRGAWNADKTTILSMFSETAALPYDNDFTSAGASLSMTGHDGVDLLGQPGLRTLVLSKQ